ncbi:MAG: hypothetical protein SGJ20_17720 [Planctomycetota bacterium]|nr:hypothetical protein [Planctomycetota bacterium]
MCPLAAQFHSFTALPNSSKGFPGVRIKSGTSRVRSGEFVIIECVAAVIHHGGRSFLQGALESRCATPPAANYCWFGWLKPGAEGDRDFDPTQAALHPYLPGSGVEICPSLDYGNVSYKYKARGAAHGYGYNLHLGQRSISISRISRPGDTVLLADAAQINDFQAPASPDNPMLEEFYYVDADDGGGYPNAHFRHRRRANVVFVDGHVDREDPVPGSIDARLPREWVGRIRPEILRLQ